MLNNHQDAERAAVHERQSNMSPDEVRAKYRRLKQTNDLKLVVIDYHAHDLRQAVESRQQEVSDFRVR